MPPDDIRKWRLRREWLTPVLCLRGRELPSLPVVLAYVSACDGDADEWQARWLELAGQAAPPDSPAADDTECEPGDPSRPDTRTA